MGKGAGRFPLARATGSFQPSLEIGRRRLESRSRYLEYGDAAWDCVRR